MSKKTTDLPEKVTPIWNDEVTWLDSQDSTLSTKDKRFKLSNMWSAIFWNRNTDNIPEWSNLYYTEARVTNNATVIWLWDNKADKSNVLEKDNTTPYTPTTDYNPATKEYVDLFSLPDSTETVKWKARLATQQEVNLGTETTSIVTPATLLESLKVHPSNAQIVALWDFTIPNSQTATKWREITIQRTGTYRIKFKIFWDTWSGNCQWIIKRNWLTVFSGVYVNQSQPVPYSTDQFFEYWDSLEVWGEPFNDPAILSDISVNGSLIDYINIL